jgi:uncharacterized Zn finger protein
MAGESIGVKGRRYLTEGRLNVTYVDAEVIRATCRGGGSVYRLGFDRDWHCNCPARGLCSHLIALQAVTVRQAAEGAEEPVDHVLGASVAPELAEERQA